jgi:hypothetical protein
MRKRHKTRLNFNREWTRLRQGFGAAGPKEDGLVGLGASKDGGAPGCGRNTLKASVRGPSRHVASWESGDTSPHSKGFAKRL